jgi:translation initiation factor 1A
MVKNTKGGSQHKKMAKKNMSNNKQQIKTRLMDILEPCELYANVTKLFGQGMCEVKCNDGVNRLCIIRNKFRGKNAQQNRVYVDCKVLVGIREWELIKEGKLPKCDLLEVYDRKQFNDIKNDPNSNWDYLIGDSEKVEGVDDKDLKFDFCDDNNENETQAEIKNEKILSQDDEEDDFINIDDM